MLLIGICSLVCFLIIFANSISIYQAVRFKIWSELFTHTGLIFFFCLLTIELTLGNRGYWQHFDIHWLKIVGLVLYIPSAYFAFSALLVLKHQGKSVTVHDPTATTQFIDSGIYAVVRQPMTLGLAIWSSALIFVFQSYLAIVLGSVSYCCFWMAAQLESAHNVKKFGEVYLEYQRKVPRWNFVRGLLKRKN